ncbi:MAG: phosphoglycerate kinase [Candidatus Tokpelaia sp. JSC085]|nr:MAG: phosphoglycerate kinase [Candidatus Tokpelaia sp. JSC085]
MKIRTLDDIDVKSKRVLLRVDLNVPITSGRVRDKTRIKRSRRTIKELSQKGSKVILLAHFGRPKGKVVACDSLKRIREPLADELDCIVHFSEDCIGDKAKVAISAMQDGDILLLENTRFHVGEEKNDPEFVKALAANGDIYVNDAFSVAHRSHASTEGLARLMPSYAGRLMQAEIVALEQGLERPKRPVVAIVGGSKVSTKINIISNLVGKVDTLVIGGGMANTFLAAHGLNVGHSLCEHELVNTVHSIMEKAEQKNCRVLLPIDVVVAGHFAAHAPSKNYNVEDIPSDGMILDVGKRSMHRICAAIDNASTLVWNGPLGAFELHPFDRGTVLMARWAAERSRAGDLVSIAGGGDTVASLNHAGVGEDFTYLSTAGGAFLEWMEGKLLPGLMALEIGP